MGINGFYFVIVLCILNYLVLGNETSKVSESFNKKYQEIINDESTIFITNCNNCINGTTTPPSSSTTPSTHQELTDRFENSQESTNIQWMCSSCNNKNPKISNFSLLLQNKTATFQWNTLDETKDECKFKYNINSTSTSIISYFRRIETNKHTLDNLKPCKNYSVTIEPSNICSTGEIFKTNFFTDPIEIEDISITFNNGQTEIAWQAAETDDCYKYKINIEQMIYETILEKSFVDSTELICKQIGIQSIREDGRLGIMKYQMKAGKVSNLKANFLNGTSYMLEWNANNNSDCVTSYLINVNDTKLYSNKTQKLLNISNYCTTSIIKVAALTEYGEGEFVTTIIPAREPEKLNEIENLTFTFNDNFIKTLVVVWNQAFSANDRNCKYTYLIKNLNYETKLTNYTFFNVEPCKNYSVEVSTKLKERFSNGKMSWFVVPGKDPHLPVLISRNVTNNSTTFHFEMIDFKSYSCSLSSLKVFCETTIVDNKNLHPIVKASTKDYLFNQSNHIFNIELANLLPYTNYSCHWIIRSTDNSLKISPHINFQTLEEAPSKPQNFHMVNRNATGFNVSWAKPLKTPGIINSYEIEITPRYSLHFLPEECNVKLTESSVDLLNGKITHFQYFSGYPSYRYELRLKAKIKGYYGPESELFIDTENSAPEAPNNYDILLKNILSDSYNVTGTLLWKYPCKPNGEIEYFALSIKETSTLTKETYKRIERININNPIKNINYSFEIINIKPLNDYDVRLNAVLKDGTTGKEAVIKFSSPDGLPGIPRLVSIENTTPTNFVINWDEPEYKTGLITNYEIKIKTINSIHTVADNCNKLEQEYSVIIPDNSTTYNFTQALSNYLYDVEIRAQTKSGFGEWLKVMHKSLRGNPEQVRNVTYKISVENTSSYDANVTISFEQPCNLNGEFQKYEIIVTGYREFYGRYDHNIILNNLTYQVHLEPEVNYSLKVSVVTNEGNSTTPEFSFTSPSGVPVLVKNATAKVKKMTPTTADIFVGQNMFRSDFGNILYYAVILSQAQHKFFTSHEVDYGFWDGVNWPETRGWNEINGSILPYQATPKWWKPFKKDDNYKENSFILYTLGKENCTHTSSNYCNGPLRTKTLYAMTVRAFTKNAFRDAPAIFFETPSINDNHMSIIIGCCFGVIAFIIIILLIIYCRRKKPKQFVEYAENVIINYKKHDYSVHKFPQYYRKLRKNPEFIKNEYKTLGIKSSEFVFSKNDAVLPHNRKKNRYTNVLPYDFNRVFLKGDDPFDYINASYIRGYTEEVEYIATQGPLETTVSDFWKMVADEKVAVIVMVAQLVEQRKEKCFKYFPNDQEEMGSDEGWLISCVSELSFEYYCERHIIIEKDGARHKIVHLQFLNWPDFDCPEGTENMLNFCTIMKEHNKDRAKIVVHCSAGVGRTGTIIAIDILLQAIKMNEDIDVFNTVLNLRKQRQNMVQTEAQYLYINTCLFDAITKPRDLLEVRVVAPTSTNINNLEMEVFDKSDTNDNFNIIKEESDIS